jgi:hypothetical protein
MGGMLIDNDRHNTIKELLSQLAGWQDYVIEVLPTMLSTIDTKLLPVDVATRNRQAMMQRQQQTGQEIMLEFTRKHEQILDLLRTIAPEDLVLRRTMGPKVFTVKSYVIDTIQNEILKCADDLSAWQSARPYSSP